MPREPRLIQLSRMLATPIEDDDAARRAITARPGDFASALFTEAADSDDVTSGAAALDYLYARLAEFDGLVSPEAAPLVEAAFRERLRAWD
jgi:hypothetical protein